MQLTVCTVCPANGASIQVGAVQPTVPALAIVRAFLPIQTMLAEPPLEEERKNKRQQDSFEGDEA